MIFDDEPEQKKEFLRELASLVNKYNLERFSDTPDFILAHHMMNSLDIFSKTVIAREAWSGRQVTAGSRQVAEEGGVIFNHEDTRYEMYDYDESVPEEEIADVTKPSGPGNYAVPRNAVGNVVPVKSCYLTLTLVDAECTEEMVASWTDEQRLVAYDWAIRCHLSASDNDDVVVPKRPEWVPGRHHRKPREYKEGMGVMDV